MIYSALKKRAQIVIKNYSEEFRTINRKKILDEFCNPDDFDYPQPIITIEKKDDYLFHKYRTTFFTKKQELVVDFVVKEYETESVVGYMINDSYIKNTNINIKTTINIIGIVAIYFLNYMKTIDDDRIIVFQTDNDATSKIDNMLLNLYKTTFPNFNYRERDFKNE